MGISEEESRLQRIGIHVLSDHDDPRVRAECVRVAQRIRQVGKKNGWRLSKSKKGFLIQGKDRIGAVQQQIQKLADKRINVTAADALTAARGRYGMLLRVKSKDYGRAARALKAR